MYTRFKISVGLKLSCHTNNLRGASNLKDEFYKIGETQNEKQFRNAFNKYSTL